MRSVLAVPVLCVALLAGCSDDDPPADESEDVQSPSAESDSPADPDTDTSPTDAGPPELPDPCEVVSPEDVGAAFGVAFSAPDPGSGERSEQGVEWVSRDCSWEAEDLMEVELALTGSEDFAAGELVCPPLLGIGAEVSDARLPGASSAEVAVQDGVGLEVLARVCTDGGNFDIEVEFEDGVDFQGDPGQQVLRLARTVLSGLSR